MSNTLFPGFLSLPCSLYEMTKLKWYISVFWYFDTLSLWTCHFNIDFVFICTRETLICWILVSIWQKVIENKKKHTQNWCRLWCDFKKVERLRVIEQKKEKVMLKWQQKQNTKNYIISICYIHKSIHIELIYFFCVVFVDNRRKK